MLIIMLLPYLILGFIYASAVVLGVTLLFCVVVLKPKRKKGKDSGYVNTKKKRDA
ncbi:hypothetical protein [Lacrimispora sp. 38-1]|uniref:hypothetical protein n=1 Tax=Lacrimispora sp. 38-1 TaxID=3125778 RepID=UPI003CEF0775